MSNRKPTQEATKEETTKLVYPKAGALCVNSPLDSVPAPSSSTQSNCPIRTELLAHSTDSNGNFDIKTLLNMAKLPTCIDEKSRSASTLHTKVNGTRFFMKLHAEAS
ncbi:MAG: hypothetical protein NWF05_08865 [Candidatus Bathyarchaeota archaeon]|nr:hypothetical protein [Candidatus Bathyarchaeota archaeon]